MTQTEYFRTAAGNKQTELQAARFSERMDRKSKGLIKVLQMVLKHKYLDKGENGQNLG